MSIVGIKGVRGGVGATSITAGLGWALKQLGERVLLIDGSPDNLLRLFFNVDMAHRDGWARAMLENRPWQSTAWRYAAGLDILPYGQLTLEERYAFGHPNNPVLPMSQALDTLYASGRWQWILVDLPAGYSPLSFGMLDHMHHVVTVLRPDANCHVRIHQQPIPQHSHIIINGLNPNSELQSDILQLWLKSLQRVIPVIVHQDESMAESLAAKQPVGEYRSDSLVAQEISTIANWCLLHISGSHK